MSTLRSRLLLGTGAGTSLILFASGLAIFGFVRAALLTEFDTSLRAAAHSIQSTTERNANGVKIESDTLRLPEYSTRKWPDYFVIWLKDGAVGGQSVSLAGANLHRPSEARTDGAYSFVTLPDGRPGRQVSLTFEPKLEDEDDPAAARIPPQVVTLAVARHTSTLDGELARLRWLLLAVGFAAIVSSGITIFIAVSRGLRPLGALARRISKIGQHNLSQQIELHDTPGELTAVISRLNELLIRLDEFVRRERAFTADVAHELRTPLGGLEATLSVSLMRERTVGEYRNSSAKSLAIVHDMHALVDNLLLLARADAGQLKLASSRVELQPLLEECWSHFQARAAARDLTDSLTVEDGLWLQTDPEKLSIVLRNLLDNAVAYSDEGGTITINACQTDSIVEVSIVNTGSRLRGDQFEKIFDRFWRADLARSTAERHCGLGLSLCQKIMELLAGKITADSPAAGDFRITLEFAVEPVHGRTPTHKASIR